MGIPIPGKDGLYIETGPWSLVLAMMSSSTPVLPALVVSATTQSNARSACNGSTRSAGATLSDWWPIQTMFVAGSTYQWQNCEVDVDGTMFDVEATFCYLGDIMCSGDSAIAARCCVAWGKFIKLLPFLTTRYLSPSICGKVYEACVHWNNPWTAAITVTWSAGFVAIKTDTKHPQVHFHRNLALRILSWSSAVSDSVLYQIYHKLFVSRH